MNKWPKSYNKQGNESKIRETRKRVNNYRMPSIGFSKLQPFPNRDKPLNNLQAAEVDAAVEAVEEVVAEAEEVAEDLAAPESLPDRDDTWLK